MFSVSETIAQQTIGIDTAQPYLNALVAQDFEGLSNLFHAQAKFKALVPSGFRESSGPGATKYLRAWLGDAEAIELRRSSVGNIGDRTIVEFRLSIRESGAWSASEQRIVFSMRDGKIAAMDLLCSGFWPEAED